MWGLSKLSSSSGLIDEIEADDHVRVVVFDSAVDGFFLTHSDFMARLEDLTSLPPGPTGLPLWPDFLVRLTRAPVASIALIRGARPATAARSLWLAMWRSPARRRPSSAMGGRCRHGRGGGVPVAVCIVDVHGNLVLHHRMNGAPLFSLEISERKAYTSRADAYGRPALAGAAWPAALCASVGRWPEFWGEVQPPASLERLDIPSRRAVFVPRKPSRRPAFGMETRLFVEEPMLSTGLHFASESTWWPFLPHGRRRAQV
jgi:Haem-degrading